MILDYLNYSLDFFGQVINWLSNSYITSSVSLLYFICGISLLSILIGGILIR
jgi:hypothetical protein